jgi:hypothetical protein
VLESGSVDGRTGRRNVAVAAVGEKDAEFHYGGASLRARQPLRTAKRGS